MTFEVNHLGCCVSYLRLVALPNCMSIFELYKMLINSKHILCRDRNGSRSLCWMFHSVYIMAFIPNFRRNSNLHICP